MQTEKYPLTGPSAGTSNGFYGTQQGTISDGNRSGISRRLLHGLTIISVLIACGCSIYGAIHNKSFVISLPFVTVVLWLMIHLLLLYLSSRPTPEFEPPGWFLFVSSGHILIQSLVVIVLTI